MANDLISRQAAIDVVKGIDSYFVKYIEEMPSAEPEIIRCNDCKYWEHVKRTNRYWCKTDMGLYDLYTSPDDFCSRAERRTDETD